jgi:uncharacterized membrane protein (UPF0127 family)
MTANPLQRILAASLVLLTVGMVSSGCTPEQTEAEDEIHDSDLPEGSDASFDPLNGYDEPDLDERLRLLRQEHDFDDEGEPCTVDEDCNAPLRCLDEGTCEFPPALTGQVDDESPYVRVVSEDDTYRFFVEIADTTAERTRGLMFRQLLTDDFGMLFIFGTESFRSFWMRNTFVSLDIIFIDESGEIVSIGENTEPLSDTSVRSEAPAKYVLEVPAGTTETLGIDAGDHIEFYLNGQ